MTSILPLQRLRETQSLVAFFHPQPSYPIHILLVPKKSIKNLTAISEGYSQLLVELFQTVKDLVVDLQLETKGYRLVVNGGENQEVPQLHFHLISGG